MLPLTNFEPSIMKTIKINLLPAEYFSFLKKKKNFLIILVAVLIQKMCHITHLKRKSNVTAKYLYYFHLGDLC